MIDKLTVLENTAAGIGACTMLEHHGRKILLDCGYYDSHVPGATVSKLPVSVSTIDIVILTHGHLGHCGLLPVLVREGFAGKVYCTENCHKIAMFSLLENALLQEEEIQYWKYKNIERDIKLLYSEKEVMACSSLFVLCQYHKNIEISNDLAISFFQAGHGPGSALVKICLKDNGKEKNILLANDIGSKENDLNSEGIIDDSYDALFLPVCRESRKDEERIESKFAQIINETVEAGGNIVIPTFSADRRDGILNVLKDLLAAGEIPKLFAFIDSPIASRQVETLPLGKDASETYPIIQVIDLVDDSKKLNQIRGTAIIIAGYGRSGYGRIGFHLLKNINRQECAIVLFGDKHNHPLWKAIEKGEKTISILDREVEIKAKIFNLNDPAVHWDVNNALGWLQKIKSSIRHIYITHGEPDAKNSFRELLEKHGNKSIKVPKPKEKIIL